MPFLSSKLKFQAFLGLALGICTGFSPSPSLARPIVVVDAAPGGADKGVQAGGNSERDWNSKFAQYLEKAFQNAGYEVVMIRNKEQAAAYEKRAEAANTSKAVAV